MNQAQALKDLDYEVHEMLFTGEENKSVSSPEHFQKNSKREKHTFMVLPSNRNQPKRMPVITINRLSKPQYEITNSVDDNVENYIARVISEVPEVEYIFLSKTKNYFELWTIINKLDRKVRERIYNVEFNILSSLRGLYFDFHVICRNDRDIKEFFSQATKIIYQRRP